MHSSLHMERDGRKKHRSECTSEERDDLDRKKQVERGLEKFETPSTSRDY